MIFVVLFFVAACVGAGFEECAGGDAEGLPGSVCGDDSTGAGPAVL